MSGYERKIGHILSLVRIALIIILCRVWHLSISQQSTLLKDAEQPRSKTLLLRAERGPIYDRFHIPLAVNRICYRASIDYQAITQIPSSRKVDGKRTWPRKEYIHSLAQLLGKELGRDPERIEDLIHAKASLFSNLLYPIQSGLTEGQYYRLKSLERDWPGLFAEMTAERFYPLGSTGCHLLGTMGAISQKKYEKIAGEIHRLKEAIALYETEGTICLPPGYASIEQVYEELHLLKKRSYTLSDWVGVSGIEAAFEEELRGYFGKKVFKVDLQGKFLRELPGSLEPIPGQAITLSISAELQKFAEELLIKNEEELEKVKAPWIRGGAIVAIEPESGEVLAMASYPRFNPNDFIHKKSRRIRESLESRAYVADVWDGLSPLCRERFSFSHQERHQSGRKFIEEKKTLGWNFYLQTLLSQESPIASFFQKISTIKSAIEVQEEFARLHYVLQHENFLQTAELFDQKGEAGGKWLSSLFSSMPPNDRLFAIDLCRLIVDSTRFSDALIEKIGALSLEEYRNLSMEWHALEEKASEEEKLTFHKGSFTEWRKENQKNFLTEMRNKEKESGSFAKPYLDYLDAKEEELFALHWAETRIPTTLRKISPDSSLGKVIQGLSASLAEEFCRSFRAFRNLDRSLSGSYRNCSTEKDLAGLWLPKGGFGRMRSYAFQTSAPQGSVFKLITAYEGLKQGHAPTLVDHRSKDPKAVAYTTSGTPYPRLYKGGRLPRSSRSYIGKIDLIGALEQSSNPYFSILAGDLLSDPNDLYRAAQLFGYGEKTGIELPGETAGQLPNDLATNRTGLYSFAIGQHTLLTTPLQSAMALTALSNGGKLLRPRIVREIKGLALDERKLSPFVRTGCIAEQELSKLGIPFALFTGKKEFRSLQKRVKVRDVRKEIPLTPSLRSQILEGMDRTVWGEKGGARPQSIRYLRAHPLLLPDFLSLRHQMIGKTGTAQLLFSFASNPSAKAQMITHTWFGAISFPNLQGEKRFETPELIVVVFSRFCNSGKEGAPLAAQMIKKWREIKKKQEI
ncbi:MAG: hypothetical protein KGI80_03380 [Verrucomicrobiota bacterium]|nr:hypothetical protein [Verrucomicrobiota bacterium]